MKKSNLLNSLVLAVLAIPGVAIPSAVMAADAHTPGTLGDVLDASGVGITGYLDVAYSNLSSTGGRVFDTEPNSFSLHQAAITLAKQPKEGYGGLVNLTMGRDARIIKSYDQATGDFDVTQAFVQHAGGPVTVIAGKFVTMAGAEVINSTANANYSRSILFGYAIPFAHTGVRATYAVNDQLSLTAGVNNGWDQAKDANKQKTVELCATFIPNKMFALAAVVYSGKEQFANNLDTVGGQRNLLDVAATINATDQLTFVLNYDNATQKIDSTSVDAKWSGVAAYANYKMNDQWLASLRTESFDDKNGYRTGITQKWKETTLTLGYMPTPSVQLRAEVRADKSDVASFMAFDGTSKKNQNSMGLEAIYKF